MSLSSAVALWRSVHHSDDDTQGDSVDEGNIKGMGTECLCVVFCLGIECS